MRTYAVSMERKQTCQELRNSRKARNPDLNMHVISLKKRYSTALFTGITRSFVTTCRSKDAHYRCMYKRNSMNILNVVDWIMDFYAYNAVAVTMNGWLRSAVNGADFARVAVPGAWPKAQPCWLTKSFHMSRCVNGC